MKADILKQQWDEVREQARRWWVDLTDEDLKDIDGDRDKLIQLLQM
jgi:hypothetical protein